MKGNSVLKVSGWVILNYPLKSPNNNTGFIGCGVTHTCAKRAVALEPAVAFYIHWVLIMATVVLTTASKYKLSN